MVAANPLTNMISGDAQAHLERFLCGDLKVIPSLELLRFMKLKAWTYQRLPSHHTLKPTCKAAFIAARIRHEQIKQEVLAMVRAWNTAGIEPLLYKGFALAEFTYPQPGTRYHSDVDVLVQPTDFKRALEIGHELGWETPAPLDHWVLNNPNPHELPLKRDQAHASFDVHQRLVPAVLPWTAREHALTQAAWAQAIRVEWEGTRIWVLCPEDAFIFGLVVSRCWSGDGWRLKPHDLLDGFALIHHGLNQKQVLKRAKKLNVLRTVTAFLERCDPFTPVLNLRPPSTFEVLRFEVLSAGEHLPLMFSRFGLRLVRTSSAILASPTLMLLWLEVKLTLWQHPDLNQALVVLEHRHTRIGQWTKQTSLIWWLARRFQQTTTLDWPVMAFVALRRQRQQAVFCLGERQGLQRAWVEVDGVVLPEFVSENGPVSAFQVVFDHPQSTKQ
jgi:Uncharacterised nucleotidyltransferase